MPIQIQCTSVVIRNDALERVMSDGASAFEELAPNVMSYADEMLSQASFMSPVDAERFAKSLELHGLSRHAEQADFVIVDSHDRSIHPPCDWLVLFEYEQRLIATMEGNDSRTVIAPQRNGAYDPDSIKHYTAEEIAEQFEFVERKGDIDTYRHKETGQCVYHARSTETADEIFRRAFDVVWQYRREPGRPALDSDDAEKLTQSISDLQSLSAKYPDSAKAPLALGMAWFAVGKIDQARKQLQRSAEIDPEDTIVLKELGSVCLEQQDFPAAVKVAQRAVAICPDDSDLLGNLAVSQLLAVQTIDATGTIRYALKLSPEDPVNQSIARIIDQVVAGKRPQPATLQEMMQRSPQKKPSFFARLFNRIVSV